jgi:hypothetical protein
MSDWQHIKEAQEAGEEGEDKLDSMLAPERSWRADEKTYKQWKTFNQIVEGVLSDDDNRDWESIRESCPDCMGVHASPWDHFIYHRRSKTQAR